MRRVWRLTRLAAPWLALLVVVSFLLRLSLADRFFPLNFNYYIPSIVLGPVGLVLAGIGRRPWRVRATLAAAVTVLWVPAVLRDQPRLLTRPAMSSSSGISVMTWNVMAYNLGESRVHATIRETAPDVLCLVEGTFRQRKPEGVSRALGENYNWAVGSRLSLATRFPIRESEMLETTRGLRVLRAVVDSPEGDIVFFVIDIYTPRLRDDQVVFDELWSLIEMETEPIVVTGDLNTPRGSYHLTRAFVRLEDCFAVAAAHRYLATWPVGLPLWQIDHTFLGNGLKTESAEIMDARASDHFPIMVRVRRATTNE